MDLAVTINWMSLKQAPHAFLTLTSLSTAIETRLPSLNLTLTRTLVLLGRHQTAKFQVLDQAQPHQPGGSITTAIGSSLLFDPRRATPRKTVTYLSVRFSGKQPWFTRTPACGPRIGHGSPQPDE
jgi:hypothetical protein